MRSIADAQPRQPGGVKFGARKGDAMDKHWIVVANQAGAKIFTVAPSAPRLKDLQAPSSTEAPSRLVEREALEHPEGRIKSQAMDADRPGRSFESAGAKRHAMTREVDPKTQGAIAFAQRVAHHLESARRKEELARLILVAAPEFLGLLRDSMSVELRRMIVEEFSLDLAQMTPQEIRAHLPETLFGGQEK
jgi:protein required for attachment to host cells